MTAPNGLISKVFGGTIHPDDAASFAKKAILSALNNEVIDLNVGPNEMSAPWKLIELYHFE